MVRGQGKLGQELGEGWDIRNKQLTVAGGKEGPGPMPCLTGHLAQGCHVHTWK